MNTHAGKAELGWETTDAYISRMQGYMMFYGALSQSERQGNPVNLTHAWQYAARCDVMLASCPALAKIEQIPVSYLPIYQEVPRAVSLLCISDADETATGSYVCDSSHFRE